jgi:hypothetical protein
MIETERDVYCCVYGRSDARTGAADASPLYQCLKSSASTRHFHEVLAHVEVPPGHPDPGALELLKCYAYFAGLP